MLDWRLPCLLIVTAAFGASEASPKLVEESHKAGIAGITIRNLSDDPSRRFFRNHPAAVMQKDETISIAYQEDRE